MASFAERLQQALQAKGMSAAQLSRELNIDEGTISNYKKGKYEPKQRRTQAIANVLNVSVDWLMGYDVESTHYSDKTENSKEACKDDFSNNLNMLRKYKNLSQDKLAEELNLSRSLIGMWESGQRKPSYETLKLLADYFDVSLDNLCGNIKTNSVGQQIKNLRLKNKLTQEEFGYSIAPAEDALDKRRNLIELVKNLDDNQCELLENLINQFLLNKNQ